ncbi:SWIM zinc finger family protein [Haladaptatus sp. CMAA 1911]|uniref:SWIM zinc finger family protein n=1 Tax=unclassified Haladaptatus TaxID=2622732 RepID=UPI0037540DBA
MLAPLTRINHSAALEADETAQNRAQADQFAFNVDAPGFVEVTNESYDKPADHQYTVSINGVTEELIACTCSHYVHCDAFCKHRAAIENASSAWSIVFFSLQILVIENDR